MREKPHLTLDFYKMLAANCTGLNEKGRKEMCYLTTYSTTYLRLYGVTHMVKDHSERGNTLPPHGLFFPISSKVFFLYASPYRQDKSYHGLCYTSRGALAGTGNS